jgi:acetyl esterase/lipase
MRQRVLGAALLLVLTGVLASPDTALAAGPQGARGPRPLPPGVTAHRNLAYVTGGHERQVLDLFIPDGAKPVPLIIMIHGGAFRMGSKDGEDPTDFLAKGFAVAAINYRLSQHAVFPAQIQDCKAAVRWLRAHAAQYGLNPDRFGAFGASAGGHLATMLGTTGETKVFETGENLSVSSRVQAVVDFFGPTDFLQMDAHRVEGGQLHDPAGSPESQLIGGPIQENRQKVAQANPITYITKQCPPFFIAHGDRDPLVPHHQSELLAAALQKAGVPVTFHTVVGAGHGFNDATASRMRLEFFEKYLRNEPLVARIPGIPSAR